MPNHAPTHLMRHAAVSPTRHLYKGSVDKPPKMSLQGGAPGEFSVRDIPKVMRNGLNWPVSAALMEKWFSLRGRALLKEEKSQTPNYLGMPSEYNDTQTITWAWLERFDQVNKATSNLIAKLQTPLAKRELSDNLTECIRSNSQWLQKQFFSPADVHPRLAEQHCAFQFQLEAVGYSIGRLDDLYGSLGNFTLYAMPARVQLSPLNSRSCKARVEGVLLYARDTFDFVGDQYLGHWGYGGLGINPVAAAMVNYIGVGAPPAWHPDAGWLKPATNQDFRNHRHLTGHGGDLLIFSDLKPHPARIEVEVTL